MPARLEATGPAPRWNDYLTRVDVNQMNGRVLRCHSLTINLTKMMKVILEYKQNWGPLANENLILARRLIWIMFYFYGAMCRFASWISDQNLARSVVRQRKQVWTDFMQSLKELFELLVEVPNEWATEANKNIVDDPGQDQQIPAEAPLELVVQIFLNRSDAVDSLDHPVKVRRALRWMAESHEFPGINAKHDENDHDGFSNCIFVTQSDTPSRVLLAGSSTIYLGYFKVKILYQKFQALRLLRFMQGPNHYDTELRLRFRNPNDQDYPLTTPERRYKSHGWDRNSSGRVLADYARKVRDELQGEFAGTLPEYPQRTAPPPLPRSQQKKWQPFSYENQRADAYFAMNVHSNQQSLFESVPRCMKCRIIHNYDIEDEDMEVHATPNDSCQCAEDIVFCKLRELNRVGNVVLADLNIF